VNKKGKERSSAFHGGNVVDVLAEIKEAIRIRQKLDRFQKTLSNRRIANGFSRLKDIANTVGLPEDPDLELIDIDMHDEL